MDKRTHSKEECSEAQALAHEWPEQAGGEAPAEIHILPRGPEIQGRDGRIFRLDDPQAVIEKFRERGVDLPIDLEHVSEKPDAPTTGAVGWVKTLELREDGIWGKVSWTQEVLNTVEAGRFRYVSPAFVFAPEDGNNVLYLTSVALTIRPNLHLHALNDEMPMPTDLLDDPNGINLSSLKPAEIEQIPEQHAESVEKPDLTEQMLARTVSYGEHHALQIQAQAAEDKLALLEAQRHRSEIKEALEEGLSAGKIVPANRAYYEAQCQAEGGLEAFRKFLKAAPVIVPKGSVAPTGLMEPSCGILTGAERAICTSVGVSEKEFLKARGQGCPAPLLMSKEKN